MMAALIFVFSVAALMQFFVSYCRSLIAASARRALSADVQDVIGIRRSASGEDFARVMQFLYLCPDRREDRKGIKAIGAYFRLLGAARHRHGEVDSFFTGLDRVGTFAVRLLRCRGFGSAYRAQPGYVRRTDVRVVLPSSTNQGITAVLFETTDSSLLAANKFPVLFS